MTSLPMPRAMWPTCTTCSSRWSRSWRQVAWTSCGHWKARCCPAWCAWRQTASTWTATSFAQWPMSPTSSHRQPPMTCVPHSATQRSTPPVLANCSLRYEPKASSSNPPPRNRSRQPTIATWFPWSWHSVKRANAPSKPRPSSDTSNRTDGSTDASNRWAPRPGDSHQGNPTSKTSDGVKSVKPSPHPRA